MGGGGGWGGYDKDKMVERDGQRRRQTDRLTIRQTIRQTERERRHREGITRKTKGEEGERMKEGGINMEKRFRGRE